MQRSAHDRNHPVPGDFLAGPPSKRSTVSRILELVESTTEEDAEEALEVQVVQVVMRRTGLKHEGLARRVMVAAMRMARTGGLTQEPSAELEVFLKHLLEPQAKVQALFQVFDARGDGMLDADELAGALKMSAAHSKVVLEDEQVSRAVCALLNSVEGGMTMLPSGNPAMDIGQFSKLLDQHPELLDIWLPPARLPEEKKSAPWYSKCLSGFKRRVGKLASRAKRLLTTQYGLFMLFICAILAGNFVWGFIVHLGTFDLDVMGYAWPIAKATAYTVRAATGLILLTVCVRFLTFLRTTFLKYLVPFDNMVAVHKLLGYVFFVCGFAHSVCHFVAKYRVASSPADAPLFAEAGLPQPTLGQTYLNWPTISGFILLVTMLAFYGFAVPFVKGWEPLKGTLLGRLLNNFNNFHFTHQIMWMSLISMLLVHPLPGAPGVPHTSRIWLFAGMPLLIFLLERVYRLWRRGQRVEVMSMVAMPVVKAAAGTDNRAARMGGMGGPVGVEGVTQLVLRVDARFRLRHRPGQFLYVQCDQVAKGEWHPFTITSAPEDEHVTVHVATKGDWTRRLYKLALDLQAPSPPPGAPPPSRPAPPPPRPAPPAPASRAQRALKATYSMNLQRMAQSGILPPSFDPNDLDAAGLDGLTTVRFGATGAAMQRRLRPTQSALRSTHAGFADASLPPSLWMGALPASAALTHEPLCRTKSWSAGVTAHVVRPQRAAPVKASIGGSMREPGSETVDVEAAGGDCEEQNTAELPCVRVDGPYGAPAQIFMDYDVLVLIAGGIGVTPMVSILRHLVHQLGVRRCIHCNKVNINMDFWLSKLYFHWIVREQGALQWFSQTLQDVSVQDPCNLCDVHIHYTPAGPPGLGNLMLRLAQEVEQEQNNICLLSGIEMKAKTSFGRPDVNEIIGRVAKMHLHARVGVLHCGAQELGSQLHKAIRQCGHPDMHLHREVF